MSLFLPVKLSGSTVSVAICDRCRKKVYYDDLVSDDNSPGLRVCKDCVDEEDPYRLPARISERVALQYPRPDIALQLSSLLYNSGEVYNASREYNE